MPRFSRAYFFPNGTVAVFSQFGRQHSRYPVGNHRDTIAALATDGFTLRDMIEALGRPAPAPSVPVSH